MKQVSPRLINVTRQYKFVELGIVCADFKDDYTKSDYKKSGCFGCKHLTGGSNYYPRCVKMHSISVKYIRKNEDGTIAPGCNTCVPKSKHNVGYSANYCERCRNYYRGGGMGKCKLKYPINKEVFRTS